MALHAKAKAEAGYRFYVLYDKIHREDVLAHAYAQCRSNKGAAGVDRQDFAERQQVGVIKGNLASVQVAHARDADELARTREQLAMSRASADTRRQTPPTKPVAKRKVPRTPRS